MKALLLSLLLLAGCAGRIDSFSDSLGAAYLTVDTLAVTAQEMCGNTVPDGDCLPGAALSTEIKRGVKVTLGEALDYLDTARELYQVGSVDLAQDRLVTARALLRSLEATLARIDQ